MKKRTVENQSVERWIVKKHTVEKHIVEKRIMEKHVLKSRRYSGEECIMWSQRSVHEWAQGLVLCCVLTICLVTGRWLRSTCRSKRQNKQLTCMILAFLLKSARISACAAISSSFSDLSFAIAACSWNWTAQWSGVWASLILTNIMNYSGCDSSVLTPFAHCSPHCFLTAPPWLDSDHTAWPPKRWWSVSAPKNTKATRTVARSAERWQCEGVSHELAGELDIKGLQVNLQCFQAGLLRPRHPG